MGKRRRDVCARVWRSIFGGHTGTEGRAAGDGAGNQVRRRENSTAEPPHLVMD